MGLTDRTSWRRSRRAKGAATGDSYRSGIPIAAIVNPYFFLLFPAALSIIAWLIPGGDVLTAGYSVKTDPSLIGLVHVAGWYYLCAVVIAAGMFAARGVSKRFGQENTSGTAGRREQRDPLIPQSAYLVLTALSVIGVVYVYAKIAHSLPVFHLIASDQVNVLKSAIPNSAGVQTLRYTTDLAGAIALQRLIQTRRPSVLGIFNLILLFLSSFLSTRLDVLLAVTITLQLECVRRPQFRIRYLWLVTICVLVFAVLIPLSYSRTADSYKASGITNPVSVTLLQMRSYLAVPAQVELGVSTAMANKQLTSELSGPRHALTVIEPSFLMSKTSPSTENTQYGPKPYTGVVNLNSAYTTNSAFADIYSEYGLWGLVYVLLTLLVAAFFYRLFLSLGGVFSLACGILIYCFAEIWRIFLFGQGIVVYLLFVTVVIGLVLRYGRTFGTWSRRRKLSAT
jgi:hypothetical protein